MNQDSPSHPIATAVRAVMVVHIGIHGVEPDGDEVAVARAIEAGGGTVAHTAGEERLGHFASSERAIRAALAIVRSVGGRDARLAVHEGDVQVSAGGGLSGTVVNAALRIARLAQPGSVLVTEIAARNAGRSAAAHLRPYGRVRLGARSAPIDLCVVTSDARDDGFEPV